MSTFKYQGQKLKLGWLAIFCSLWLAGCKGEAENADRPDMESIEIRPEVIFTVVNDEPLRFYIESRGVVEPLQRMQIIPRLSGYISQHNIKAGQWINKGDIILQLNEEEWKNAERQAFNQYIKAKNDYEIESRLRSQGSTGTTQNGDELVRITTGFAEAELSYERAKLNLSYATIKAPFSGQISTKEVLSAGAFVSAGQELGILIDDSKVNVRFDVLESEIDALAPGMQVELTGPGNNRFEGKIVAVAPHVDSQSKTGQVLVEVDNPDRKLKSGMTVEGRVFVRSMESKVKMPREALLERDGRTLVFKLNREEVQWIYVTPEAMNTEWVLINHPEINPGDTLAVDQHFSISHQQKVIPLLAIN